MLDAGALFFLFAYLVFPIASAVAWRRKARKTAIGFGLLSAAMIATIAANSMGPSESHKHKNQCIANLKLIDGAIQQWALEQKKVSTDTYSLSDPVLLGLLKGSVLPTCPGGGHYSSGASVAGEPKCSLAAAKGHTL